MGICCRLIARRNLLCPLYKAPRDDGQWPLQVLLAERTKAAGGTMPASGCRSRHLLQMRAAIRATARRLLLCEILLCKIVAFVCRLLNHRHQASRYQPPVDNPTAKSQIPITLSLPFRFADRLKLPFANGLRNGGHPPSPSSTTASPSSIHGNLVLPTAALEQQRCKPHIYARCARTSSGKKIIDSMWLSPATMASAPADPSVVVRRLHSDMPVLCLMSRDLCLHSWELARIALGARRGYREFTRMAQGSSPEEDQDSLEDCRGSRKAYREKLTGNTPRDHRKKIGRLAARMSEAAGLTRVRSWFRN
ncbi:hypothetical protein BHM03_00061696 [Ensete ventricosum]|nr:hypothetical protein BHM03_00061696 [Ensete ventricosum]